MRIINNSLCVKVIMFVIIIINSAFNYSQSKFAFHRNNSLYISTTDGAISKVGTDLKIKESKKFITSNCLTYHTMPNDILTKINISDGMVFYSALQPLLGNQWVFVERSLENSSYNLCLFSQFPHKPIFLPVNLPLTYCQIFQYCFQVFHNLF